jgi:queuine/archaeosine tRNA-ribosyltransferase
LVRTFSESYIGSRWVNFDVHLLILNWHGQIKPKDYVEMISCLKPNIWATLADEVPAWVSDKRNRTSVDRTLRWLDDCLALNPVMDTSCFSFLVIWIALFMNSWKF